jgi:hypothetical protein
MTLFVWGGRIGAFLAIIIIIMLQGPLIIIIIIIMQLALSPRTWGFLRAI